jgi:glycolate dehydrogenase FAD-binding subunit
MTTNPTTVEALREAIAGATAISLRGASSKATATGDATLVRLTDLRGIVDYVPEECVFTARAGTPLREINAALAAAGQYLPFDPPLVAAGATIGGTIAAGLSGPGRYRYGGIRDFLIGAAVVDGEGRLLRSGGKVVKNAAGFLLHHAVVGSAGAYGAIVEATFKVFPAPEARATLRVDCGTALDAHGAIGALTAQRFELAAADYDARGTLWVRLAGRASTLGARVVRAVDVLKTHFGDKKTTIERLPDADEVTTWTDAAEFAWAPREAGLVKVPLTPAQIERVAALGPDPTRIRFSSAGSVAWIAWEDELQRLSTELARLDLKGVCVCGAFAGTRLGAFAANAFEDRVRRVLDPQNRFRAAPTLAH